MREELAAFGVADARFRGLLHMRGLQTSALAMDAFEVQVPSMGESITEGTIANVLKKQGASGGDPGGGCVRVGVRHGGGCSYSATVHCQRQSSPFTRLTWELEFQW